MSYRMLEKNPSLNSDGDRKKTNVESVCLDLFKCIKWPFLELSNKILELARGKRKLPEYDSYIKFFSDVFIEWGPLVVLPTSMVVELLLVSSFYNNVAQVPYAWYKFSNSTSGACHKYPVACVEHNKFKGPDLKAWSRLAGYRTVGQTFKLNPVMLVGQAISLIPIYSTMFLRLLNKFSIWSLEKCFGSSSATDSLKLKLKKWDKVLQSSDLSHGFVITTIVNLFLVAYDIIAGNLATKKIDDSLLYTQINVTDTSIYQCSYNNRTLYNDYPSYSCLGAIFAYIGDLLYGGIVGVELGAIIPAVILAITAGILLGWCCCSNRSFVNEAPNLSGRSGKRSKNDYNGLYDVDDSDDEREDSGSEDYDHLKGIEVVLEDKQKNDGDRQNNKGDARKNKKSKVKRSGSLGFFRRRSSIDPDEKIPLLDDTKRVPQ